MKKKMKEKRKWNVKENGKIHIPISQIFFYCQLFEIHYIKIVGYSHLYRHFNTIYCLIFVNV